MTEVENGDGDTTDYTYDDDGNVLTVTDGLGHTETYTYDDMGQVLTDTQPLGGGTTTYAYDEAGRLVSLEIPTTTSPPTDITVPMKSSPRKARPAD